MQTCSRVLSAPTVVGADGDGIPGLPLLEVPRNTPAADHVLGPLVGIHVF
jgi:hypothetical protein